MSESSSFDEEDTRRDHKAPYSNKHSIPTIQRYREHRGEIDDHQKQAKDAQQTPEEDSRGKRAFTAVKTIFHNEDKKHAAGDPYPAANRNTEEVDKEPGEHDSGIPSGPSANGGKDGSGEDTGDSRTSTRQDGDDNAGKGQGQSATEKAADHIDPRDSYEAQ